ncbi:hypothetical protein EPN83_01565 [Patescibacteria group bacterium]|nr:MAG: hypothetical protein EPN83_01565 [Patescibacteria group bacterium]
MFLTIVFFFSLAGLVVLVGLKVYEFRSGRRVISRSLLAKWNAVLHRETARGRGRLTVARERGRVFLVRELPRHSEALVDMLRREFERAYQKFLEKVRGSRVLHSNGKVSDFLEKISEERKNGKKNNSSNTSSTTQT